MDKSKTNIEQKCRNNPKELPKSHWPKEIRYKGRGERGGEFKRGYEGR
jgi:hypothetical protein